MALLSNLMIRIGVDPDGVRRGVNKADRELDKLRDSTNRLSRDMGRSGSDGGVQFSENFTRDAAGRLRDSKGRFAKAGEGIGTASGGGFLKGFGKVLKKMTGGASGMLKAAAPMLAMGSAVLSLLPLLPGLVSGLVTVTQVALAAAPALIALGAGALILKTAFGAMFAQGTAARKALEPLAGMFRDATKAGSEAAAKGIRPLAEALKRVAQPIVTKFMTSLGQSANRVQKDFLKWAKSTDGLKTLRGILEPLSKMVTNLAPHVSALGIAFARMLGRVMGVSTAMGTKGLAGALDWLTKKLNGINADNTSNALTKIANAGRTVMKVISMVAGWIGKLVTAYRTYTTQFGLVADALAVVAIIFGGPITAAIAAAGLIIRHFDQIKAGWQKLKAAFTGSGGASSLSKAFDNLKAAAAIVWPPIKKAFDQIKAAVLPVLMQIGDMIVNDLIPTLSRFALAMAPIVAWLIGVLGPVVANTFKAILVTIQGALNIVSGIIKVFTAIITGDWGLAWQGIKQILKGAIQVVQGTIIQFAAMFKGIWQGVLGVLSAIWNRMKSIAISAARALITGAANALSSGIARVRSALNRIKSTALSAVSGAAGWLVGAGRAIINGLISGVSSAIGRLKGLLNRVTSMIPSWKGPMRVDMKLLQPTGAAIMGGLVTGVRKSLPGVRKAFQGVTADIPSYAAPTGVAQAATRQAAPEIVVKSGGSRIDDALVELLRRAIADKGGDVQRVLGR